MATILDPSFAPPVELPFPIGTSPFRQKGNAYLGDMKYLNAVVPGGFEAVLAALPDPSVRTFFKQGIRPSEWYDAYPGAVLETTAAKLRGLSFEKHRRETGAWHAADAAKGIYSALLKVISTDNIALWGPRISSLYFEFGSTESRMLSDKHVIAIRRGIPCELAQWLIYAAAGFCAGAIKLAGASSSRVDIGEVTPDGRSLGRDLVKIEVSLRWT